MTEILPFIERIKKIHHHFTVRLIFYLFHCVLFLFPFLPLVMLSFCVFMQWFTMICFVILLLSTVPNGFAQILSCRKHRPTYDLHLPFPFSFYSSVALLRFSPLALAMYANVTFVIHDLLIIIVVGYLPRTLYRLSIFQ